ncbi:MAG: hypothetical protein BJ554DRAFT_8174, partial [Olpidium bornovanus]
MNYLAAGYNVLRGPAGTPQQGPETVDKLCDRVLHANLLDDRRAAVLGLKSMSRDWKLVRARDVGTKGMAPLIKTLEHDYHDPEITVAALETLNTLCSVVGGNGEPPCVLSAVFIVLGLAPVDRAQEGSPFPSPIWTWTLRLSVCPVCRFSFQPEDDLGVQFTEIYVKTPKNVHTLLGILENTDFYVRFNTVQLLGTLMQNKGEQLQDCILTAPMGMTRLIDLLDDTREA